VKYYSRKRGYLKTIGKTSSKVRFLYFCRITNSDMKQILGIGNALVDILIRIDSEEILKELNLPKGSMQLVNKGRSDEILERLASSPYSLAAGGSAANTIHGLAMLGAPVGYIGVVGSDDFGRSFEDDMVRAGVDPLMIHSTTETGRAITLITPDSERTFATCLGAAVELSAEHLIQLQSQNHPSRLTPHASRLTPHASRLTPHASPLTPHASLSSFQYMHLEGYLVQNHQLIRTAMELAKAHNMIVSLDMASYNVVEANLDFLREMVASYVDILFANEEEAKVFTGMEPEGALHHIGQFCEVAVVKTGEKGSLIKHRDVVTRIGVIPVNHVDTTGAGDLYAAGFLYGHANGWPLLKCGEAGSLLAGNIIEETGAKMPEHRWRKVIETLVTG